MPGMERNRDLLPWILGGMLIATAAIAITMGTMKAPASVAPAPLNASVPVLLPPAPPALPTAPVVAEITPVAGQTPAPEPAISQPEAAAAQKDPSGQIWACTTNGIKTFSNNPCGEKSTLLDVGPTNTMEATRVLPAARIYPPESHFEPAYTTEEAPEQPEDTYSSYGGGVALIPYYPRKRPTHRYPSQHRGPQPRSN